MQTRTTFILAALLFSVHFSVASAYTAGFHGCDGDDGAIVRSADTVETKAIRATTYVVNAGVVVTPAAGTGGVNVCATTSITINGIINVTGFGRGGATQGNNAGGGFGGGATSTAGGLEMTAETGYRLYHGAPISNIDWLGSGGAANGTSCSAIATSNGGSGGGGSRVGGLGGTGSGIDIGGGTNNGQGGSGGGYIALSAPLLVLGGASKLIANGTNGNPPNGANCGGGGGGSGGSIHLEAETLTETTGFIMYAGGAGAAGGGGAAAGRGGCSRERAALAGGAGANAVTGGGGGAGGACGLLIRRVPSSGGDDCDCVGNQWFNATFLQNATFDNVTIGNFTLLSAVQLETAWDEWIPLLIWGLLAGFLMWRHFFFAGFTAVLALADTFLTNPLLGLGGSMMLVATAFILEIIYRDLREFFAGRRAQNRER